MLEYQINKDFGYSQSSIKKDFLNKNSFLLWDNSVAGDDVFYREQDPF